MKRQKTVRKLGVRPAILNTREAARYVGLSPSTLEKMRCYAHLDGPPFTSINMAVGYRVTDLDAWLAKRVFKTTRQRDEALGRHSLNAHPDRNACSAKQNVLGTKERSQK